MEAILGMDQRLIEFAVDKVVREANWEEIEDSFRPITGVDLLLRLDFEGMKKKITEWFVDNSPDAMPHRFRGPYLREMNLAIAREDFYRKLKEKKNNIH